MAKKQTDSPEIEEKKKLALEVIRRLKLAYPDAHCTLAYEDAWQLLVSVRLAAQCTDKRVDMITPKLFERFPSVAALAAADPLEIEEIVRPCGLGPSKARDISGCMRMLHEEYQDHVPDTMEELVTLPGVGRKTANVVLNVIFGKPTIPVDTHLFRVAPKIGLAQGSTPLEVEQSLLERVPKKYLKDAHHWLLLHGRYVCVSRSPKCDECVIKDLCKKNQE